MGHQNAKPLQPAISFLEVIIEEGIPFGSNKTSSFIWRIILGNTCDIRIVQSLDDEECAIHRSFVALCGTVTRIPVSLPPLFVFTIVLYTFTNSCSPYLTTSTGQGALRTTFSAVLPKRICSMPVCPCVAIIMRLLFSSKAYWLIS